MNAVRYSQNRSLEVLIPSAQTSKKVLGADLENSLCYSMCIPWAPPAKQKVVYIGQKHFTRQKFSIGG